MLKRNLSNLSWGETRPTITEEPEYFSHYLKRVPSGNIIKLLEEQELNTIEVFRNYEAKLDIPYAEGKWTIRQVLLHLMDVERVFQYRVLSGQRTNGAKLPGFDHDKWAKQSVSNSKSLNDLLIEFQAIRSSTLHLILGVSEAESKHRIYRDDLNISILAMTMLFWGHVDHHIDVMKRNLTA